MEILKLLLILFCIVEGFYLVYILLIAMITYEYFGDFKLFITDLLIPFRRFYMDYKNKKVTKK